MSGHPVLTTARSAWLRLAVAVSLAACASQRVRGADELHVGPGRTYATPDRVPWESLEPGDRVLIDWRPEPYRSKWVLCCRGAADSPITISGIPGPGGELPVLDAENALAPISVDYTSGERGVIKIGGAGFAPELMPGHIVIENLEIRGARPGRFFVSRRGILQYFDSASAIYVEKGDHITVRNCVLHDCANGFFTAHETAEILLDSCHVYDNGLEDSIFQHNSYTESAGMVYQFNRFGPLREGCSGNNIKDRSAGLVVRCNWIEGGNRQLDLVDAEDSEVIRQDPRYDTAYVYGNVLIEPDGAGNNQIVHFGGDNGPEETFRHGPLYFYNNTVVSLQSGKTCLLRLSTNDVTARVFNNILYVAATGDLLSILDESGIVNLSHNFLKPGWRGSHGELTGVIRADDNIEMDDPGFSDLSDLDLTLRMGSAAIDRGAGDPPSRHPVNTEFAGDRGSRERPVHGALDLGAFEH
jgi:hypothetical protein